MFILREDLTPEDERDLIEDFLLPSLAVPAGIRKANSGKSRPRSVSRSSPS
jgi:hypothetical protein